MINVLVAPLRRMVECPNQELLGRASISSGTLRRLLAAGLFSAQAAWVGAATELRIAAQEETTPEYIKNAAGGGAIGLCVDLLHALERAAPEISFVGGARWKPVIRVQSEMFAGHQDAACGLAHTKERDEHMTFLEPALLRVDYVLIARAGDNIDVNSWDDVRKLGKNGIVLGNRDLFASEFLAEAGGIFYETGAAASTQNLHKLLVGRGRFFLRRAHGVSQLLQQTGVANRVRVVPAPMGGTQLYFALGKHVGDEATKKLRRALKQLQTTGELERIRKRWYWVENPRANRLRPNSNRRTDSI